MAKSEIPFNFRLNNHRSEVFHGNVILICRYFAQDKQRSKKHAKFTLIESTANTNKTKEAL